MPIVYQMEIVSTKTTLKSVLYYFYYNLLFPLTLNYPVGKKQGHLILAITSANSDRFSKFFHRRTRQ